jgi:hypothetical protein
MTRRPWILLAPLVLLTFIAPARPAEDDPLDQAVDTLKRNKLDTDTKALVAMIKKRTVSETTRAKVAGLIKQLGADEFDDREKASDELIEMGGAARAQLTAALKNSDLEIRKRARKALDKIPSLSADADILPAAAFVLASRKPADVAELLLDFLPSIEEHDTAVEVARVLWMVAKDKKGKVDPALITALSDKKYPIKRLAAGDALARSALKDQKDAVLKLLEDDSPTVRRYVAEALVRDVKDNGTIDSSIPALIKLTGSDSVADREAAVAVLEDVAGEKSPSTSEDLDSPKARQNFQKAWEGWWKGAKVDLKKVDFEGAAGKGEILIGSYGWTNNKRNMGSLIEMDKDGKTKWEILDLLYPVYACKTKRDRVLVCEHNGGKVTERDVKDKGKVLWEKTGLQQPLACERLRNGNTFIVTRNELLEVDRKGTTVRSVNRNNTYDIVTAGRHKDGTYTMITTNTTIIRYDANLKQLSSVSLNRWLSYTTGLKCAYLPNGHVVIPDYGSSRLREYDKEGKQVVEINATYPTAVSKLNHGGYLYLSRQGNQLIEIDKEGKQLSTKAIPNNNVRSNPLFMERK